MNKSILNLVIVAVICCAVGCSKNVKVIIPFSTFYPPGQAYWGRTALWTVARLLHLDLQVCSM